MALEGFQGSLKQGWMKPGAWHAAPGFGPNFQFTHTPSPTLPPPCAIICWSNPLSRATSSQILWEVKGHTNCELFSEVTRMRAFYSFLNLEETELGAVVFLCRIRHTDFLSQKKTTKKKEDGQRKMDQSGPCLQTTAIKMHE